MPYRDAQLPHPAIWLRYFYPPHGAWPIRPTFKSLPHFQPVRFQAARQASPGKNVDFPCTFASGFLQTSPHDDALAFR